MWSIFYMILCLNQRNYWKSKLKRIKRKIYDIQSQTSIKRRFKAKPVEIIWAVKKYYVFCWLLIGGGLKYLGVCPLLYPIMSSWANPDPPRGALVDPREVDESWGKISVFAFQPRPPYYIRLHIVYKTINNATTFSTTMHWLN